MAPAPSFGNKTWEGISAYTDRCFGFVQINKLLLNRDIEGGIEFHSGSRKQPQCKKMRWSTKNKQTRIVIWTAETERLSIIDPVQLLS